MRVLMLGWEFPPHLAGGLGTACRALACGLSEAGVEVLFVVPRLLGGEHPGDVELVACDRVSLPTRRLRYAKRGERTEPEVVRLPSSLRPYDSVGSYAARLEFDRLRSALGRPGADVRPLADVWVETGGESAPLPFEGGYGPSLLAEVERYARVVEHLAREREFDVVHAHDWMTWPAGVRAASLRDRPLVCHVHATEYDRSGERADPRIETVERLGLARADRVVCVSRRTADLVERRFGVDPGKVAVVHNGVEAEAPSEPLPEPLPEFRPEPAPGTQSGRAPLVLFLGRVTSQKGPEYFLRAAARVAAVRPDVEFAVVGDGDLLPRTVARAAELGLEGRVRFPGFLDDEGVRAMFACADVFVLSSVSEPFGLTPLEALRADVPVVVSRQSGVSEVLNCGLKFDYWDVEDLAGKVLALLERGPLRRQVLEEARAELPHLHWRHRARTLEQLYRELVP